MLVATEQKGPVVASGNGDVADEAVAAEANPAAALENGANVWPDETAESAFFAEQREQGAPVPVAAAAEVGEEIDAGNPLPTLDELVKRISPDARELMDELFRAKFTTVKRVPKTALKA